MKVLIIYLSNTLRLTVWVFAAQILAAMDVYVSTNCPVNIAMGKSKLETPAFVVV